MTATVWKYNLQVDTVLQLPIDAEVLTVAEQAGNLCLWARVDPLAVLAEPRRFITVGTGCGLPAFPSDNYIGTVMLQGGALVVHVFEVFDQ